MKSRIKELIKEFVQGKSKRRVESSVSTDGWAIYSYTEKMAEWKDGILRVYPIDRRSVTTVKHYSMLHLVIAQSDIDWGIAPRELSPLP